MLGSGSLLDGGVWLEHYLYPKLSMLAHDRQGRRSQEYETNLRIPSIFGPSWPNQDISTLPIGCSYLDEQLCL